MTEPSPHPHSKCPYCGLGKAVLSWKACSQFCADYMDATPQEAWKLPNAYIGPDYPTLPFGSDGHQRTKDFTQRGTEPGTGD